MHLENCLFNTDDNPCMANLPDGSKEGYLLLNGILFMVEHQDIESPICLYS